MKLIILNTAIAAGSISAAIVCDSVSHSFTGLPLAALLFAEFCFVAACATFLFFAVTRIIDLIGRM